MVSVVVGPSLRPSGGARGLSAAPTSKGEPVVRAGDLVAIELGEGNERHDLAAVDVLAAGGDRSVGPLGLGHLEHALRAGRADRDHHQAAGLELLQQRRRHMVDTAGHDDLVERTRLFPAVVAVGVLGLDVLVLGVALVDQLVVQRARAGGERSDDLDRVGVLGEVGDVGRLHARAGADLEHLLAALDVDDVGHAALQMRPGHGDAIADIEEVVLVGALVDRRIDRGEFLARRQQEGPDGGGAPDVLVAYERLEAVPALAEENRILAAGDAPGDEIVAGVGRRVEIPAIGLDACGHGRQRETCSSQCRRAGDECASLQDILLGAGPGERGDKPTGRARRFGGDRTASR